MNEILLAHYYKIYMVTPLLYTDVKSIRKINGVCAKFIKTKRVSYIVEIINILNILNNAMDVKKAKKYILEYIEFDYKYKIGYIIDNLDMLDCKIILDMENFECTS